MPLYHRRCRICERVTRIENFASSMTVTPANATAGYTNVDTAPSGYRPVVSYRSLSTGLDSRTASLHRDRGWCRTGVHLQDAAPLYRKHNRCLSHSKVLALCRRGYAICGGQLSAEEEAKNFWIVLAPRVRVTFIGSFISGVLYGAERTRIYSL